MFYKASSQQSANAFSKKLFSGVCVGYMRLASLRGLLHASKRTVTHAAMHERIVAVEKSEYVRIPPNPQM